MHINRIMSVQELFATNAYLCFHTAFAGCNDLIVLLNDKYAISIETFNDRQCLAANVEDNFQVANLQWHSQPFRFRTAHRLSYFGISSVHTIEHIW